MEGKKTQAEEERTSRICRGAGAGHPKLHPELAESDMVSIDEKPQIYADQAQQTMSCVFSRVRLRRSVFSDAGNTIRLKCQFPPQMDKEVSLHCAEETC